MGDVSGQIEFPKVQNLEISELWARYNGWYGWFWWFNDADTLIKGLEIDFTRNPRNTCMKRQVTFWTGKWVIKPISKTVGSIVDNK